MLQSWVTPHIALCWPFFHPLCGGCDGCPLGQAPWGETRGPSHLGWESHTVQVGVLDVDGLRGLVIGRAVRVVGRGPEHLQHSLGEARLEHHAAASDAHILTARVQVVDAHGNCRPESKHVRPCPLPSFPGFALCPCPTPASGWFVCVPLV